MKVLKSSTFKNTIELTGVIEKMDEYKYIPNPMIGFQLISHRRRKTTDEEWKTDMNRIIVFDEEDFTERFHVGQRVKIKGEIQSRNYNRDENEVSEEIQSAVDMYVMLYDRPPTKRPPQTRRREPIDWSLFDNLNLLEEVPEDSMYLHDGSKQKSQERMYTYRIDKNYEVFKETEHTAYEVVAFSVEVLDEELPDLKGDINRATILGKLSRTPRFDILGAPFCNGGIQTTLSYFTDEERVAFPNFIAWGDTAEQLANLKRGDYVQITGRLQSRPYTKTVVKRWKTPAGKRKKADRDLNLMTREISVSKWIPVDFSSS